MVIELPRIVDLSNLWNKIFTFGEISNLESYIQLDAIYTITYVVSSTCSKDVEFSFSGKNDGGFLNVVAPANSNRVEITTTGPWSKMSTDVVNRNSCTNASLTIHSITLIEGTASCLCKILV